jgi:hypothetical protein
VIGFGHGSRVMLDYYDGVSSIPEAPQQAEQPVYVTGVKADRWLVEHVQSVYQARAEGVGEGDSLGLAPGESPGLPAHGEITQPYIQ